jgi:hypothetical protein
LGRIVFKRLQLFSNGIGIIGSGGRMICSDLILKIKKGGVEKWKEE